MESGMGASYCVLFIATIVVNKYVLSVLNFTYPTIFQGWQTMFGAILLNIISHFRFSNIQLHYPTRLDVAMWLPGMLCYVIMIYSGSVALANLSVPAFVASTTLTDVVKYAKTPFVFSKEIIVYCYICHMLIVGSVVGVTFTDPQFSGLGYSWLCIHVLSAGALEIYSYYISGRLKLKPFQKLNLNYIYSVVILAPCSYFLGDALDARKFPYLYFTKFYFGCVLSGIFGVLLSVVLIKIKDQHAGSLHPDLLVLISKVLLMGVSLIPHPPYPPPRRVDNLDPRVSPPLPSPLPLPRPHNSHHRHRGGLGQLTSAHHQIGITQHLLLLLWLYLLQWRR